MKLTEQKIADMLDSETGTWEAPTAYDDLPGGIRLIAELMRDDEVSFDSRQWHDALRWIREASDLLIEIQPWRPSLSESKP